MVDNILSIMKKQTVPLWNGLWNLCLQSLCLKSVQHNPLTLSVSQSSSKWFKKLTFIFYHIKLIFISEVWHFLNMCQSFPRRGSLKTMRSTGLARGEL